MPRQKAQTPTPKSETPSETSPETEAALQQVETVAQALQTGRAPRGRKPLRDAIRLFKNLNRPADAFRALLVLAELENRQGEIERALTGARTAQRLAEQHPDEPWLDHSLELLARLLAESGQHEKALEHARQRVQRARTRGRGPETVDALRALTRILWQAGETEEALHSAAEALAEAEECGDAEALARARRALGWMLLTTGCAQAAYHYFTEALRGPISLDDRIHVLLSRGSASMCMGNYDAAARDYRRALRESKAHPDRRLEVETTAAVAAAEAVRGHEERSEERVAKATKLVVRAERRSRPLRDAQLERKVEFAHKTAAHGEAALAEATALPGSPSEVAKILVKRAYGTQSEIFVDACRREVEWLAKLEHQTPPYHCGFDIPFLSGP